jgi:hypothetical protein
MTFTGGAYTDAQINAPGAWGPTQQQEPTPNVKKPSNANHIPYTQAIAVQERSASRCFVSNMNVKADGTAIKIVDKLRGRKWIMLKVTTASTTGVYIQSEAADIVGPTGTGTEANPEGWHMAASDPPIMWVTEDSFYAVTDTIGSSAEINIAVGVANTSEYEY